MFPSHGNDLKISQIKKYKFHKTFRQISWNFLTSSWFGYMTSSWLGYLIWTSSWFGYLISSWFGYQTSSWFGYLTSSWLDYLTSSWLFYLTSSWFVYLTSSWFVYLISSWFQCFFLPDQQLVSVVFFTWPAAGLDFFSAQTPYWQEWPGWRAAQTLSGLGSISYL